MASIVFVFYNSIGYKGKQHQNAIRCLFFYYTLLLHPFLIIHVSIHIIFVTYMLFFLEIHQIMQVKWFVLS